MSAPYIGSSSGAVVRALCRQRRRPREVAGSPPPRDGSRLDRPGDRSRASQRGGGDGGGKRGVAALGRHRQRGRHVHGRLAGRWPEIVVATGLTGEGLPLSTQIIGYSWDKATVLRAALAVEHHGLWRCTAQVTTGLPLRRGVVPPARAPLPLLRRIRPERRRRGNAAVQGHHLGHLGRRQWERPDHGVLMATKAVILAAVTSETLQDNAGEDVVANVVVRDTTSTRGNTPIRAAVPTKPKRR